MIIRLVAFDCKINTVWSKTNFFEDLCVLLIKLQRVVLFQFLDSNFSITCKALEQCFDCQTVYILLPSAATIYCI